MTFERHPSTVAGAHFHSLTKLYHVSLA